MSSWTKICSVIALFFFVSSCGLLPYEPTIDYRGSEKKGADLERYDDDLSSCKKLAEQTVPNSEHYIEKDYTNKFLKLNTGIQFILKSGNQKKAHENLNISSKDIEKKIVHFLKT